MSPDPVMPPWLADVVPFTDEDLDRALAWDAQHAGKPLPEPGTYEADMSGQSLLAWQPADDEQAEAIMARLAWNQQKLADLDAKRKSYAERIGAWFEKDAKPIKRRVQRYTEALQLYGVEYRRLTRKATLNLPSGVVPTQERQPAVCLPTSDEGMAKLVAWAKELPVREGGQSLVHTQETVLISELRKVARVVEEVVRVEHHYRLVCGHWVVAGSEDHAVGEIVECPDCRILMAVTSDEVVQVLDVKVVGPDGLPVPGVVIDPGGIVALAPKPSPL